MGAELLDGINPRVWDRQEMFIRWYARLGRVGAAARLAQVASGTVGHWRRLDRYGVCGRMDAARAEFLRKRALIGVKGVRKMYHQGGEIVYHHGVYR